MAGLTDWYGMIRGAKPPASERATSDAAPAAPLTAKLQRLAELQEELRELERLPGLLGAVVDGSGDMVALPALPYWQERAGELQVEIEHLREEIAAKEADRAAHPRASEEVGARILDQIEESGPARAFSDEDDSSDLIGSRTDW